MHSADPCDSQAIQRSSQQESAAQPNSTWRLVRLALVVSWLGVIATATHWPTYPAMLRTLDRIPYSDKPCHFLLYFILGWVLWYRREMKATELVLVNGLAVVDEWTQPWVGRTADLTDWCADVLGLLAAIVVLRAFHKMC